jgi:RimJ/RimL family protein N-acetyltransferase
VSPSRPNVRLVRLEATTIGLLADGDLPAARSDQRSLSLDGIRHTLSSGLVAPSARRTWRYRAEQLARSADDLDWITRVIVDDDLGRTVGMAGFHGPPDERGMVEIGYRVDEALRRQGYARAALEALLDAASRDPAVTTVRATISPDNEASRALVAQYAFERVGEQWDDEDGLEIVFERPA